MRCAHTATAADRCFLRPWRQGNVLFFDRMPAAETPWTRELWVYDLRTNMHFTLKQNRDDSLENTDNLPPPEVIAQEIVEDLEAALAEFAAIARSLEDRPQAES